MFAREFVAKGAAVAVYDIKFDDPFAREPLAKIAAEDGAARRDSPASAIEGAEIVISAVTADQAVAAARAAAAASAPRPDLRRPQFRLADAPSAPSPPALERRRFRRVRGDVAGRAGSGIASPILAGGARAAELAARLNPLGMKIDVVSAEIGVASATKLCRSIVIKGLEAIMVDLNLAADRRRRDGGACSKSLTASYPGMDWARSRARCRRASRATACAAPPKCARPRACWRRWGSPAPSPRPSPPATRAYAAAGAQGPEVAAKTSPPT